MPTTRMKALSQMLEGVGHSGVYFAASTALELHDHQHHGPDPDVALSKFRTSPRASPRLRRPPPCVEEGRGAEAENMGGELEEALKALKEELERRG